MQTSIDKYFKSRKRPAENEMDDSYSKITARNLFDNSELNKNGLIDKPSLKASKEWFSRTVETIHEESIPVTNFTIEQPTSNEGFDSSTITSRFSVKSSLTSLDQNAKYPVQCKTPESQSMEQNAKYPVQCKTPESQSMEQNEKHPVQCKTPESQSTEQHPVQCETSESESMEQNEKRPIACKTPVSQTMEQNKRNVLKTPELLSPERISLKKELGLGEFRKLLTRREHLGKLKQSLKDYKSNEEKLRNIMKRKREMVNRHESNCLEFEVPTSPIKQPTSTYTPRKLTFSSVSTSSLNSIAGSPSKDKSYVSPRKLLDEGPSYSPTKPAHERFNHLLATGKDPLVLPFKYSALKETFHSVDTIVKILTDRGEMVTFSKLKPDVQRMSNRNFTLSHLGQIKTVYPDSYDFTQQRIKAPFGQSEKYELIIKPGTGMFSLSKREKIFREALLNRTKRLHEAFLRTLDPPIEVGSNRVTRWHPCFDVDNVPDIEPATIPEAPVENKIISAKTFLEKAQHSMLRCNNKMSRMFDSVDVNKKSTLNENDDNADNASAVNEKIIQKREERLKNIESVPSVAALRAALKGIPKPLLEKIRAKQAAKMKETLTQSPAEMKRSLMHCRLPELARIARNIFVTEKKTVLPQEFVLLKVSHSYRENLTRKEFIDHFNLISQYLPGWFCIFKVSNVDYMKLSKDTDMGRIIGKLEALAKD